jgi:hypothetical protein
LKTKAKGSDRIGILTISAIGVNGDKKVVNPLAPMVMQPIDHPIANGANSDHHLLPIAPFNGDISVRITILKQRCQW